MSPTNVATPPERKAVETFFACSVILTVALMAALAIGTLAADGGPIREYPLPLAGAFPHGVAAGPDGIVYFTETFANRIGSFDPRSGSFGGFAVPTADAAPRGLAIGADGWIVFTESKASRIGRLDPKNGSLREFHTDNASTPDTPAIGPNGDIYFTAPGDNVIGRLDPQSGSIAAYAIPTPNSEPLGIKLGPDDALYFTESATNKLGRIDAKTSAIEEFATPTAASAPRRLWFSGDDLYFTEFAVGKLGRLRLKDRSMKEWASPGGAGSQPDGIAIDKRGRVWYDESARGTMVQFDPSQETFASFPVPSSNAVISNMDVAPDGRIWMALSGADRIAVIDVNSL